MTYIAISVFLIYNLLKMKGAIIMIMLVLGIIILICGIIGLIKPELMIGKNKLNGSEEENNKKLKNTRIVCVVLVIWGILMLVGAV